MRHIIVLLVFAINWYVSCSQRFQQIGRKYYYIEHYDKLNWFHAREKCRSMNAHLVSIQHYGEWSAIRDQLVDNISYWVDIIDKDSDYNFISDTTGRRADYLKWFRNEPSDRKRFDCVKLKAGYHYMATTPCSWKDHYICEKA